MFLPIFHESVRRKLCTGLSRASLEVCSTVQSAPERTQLKSLPRMHFCGSCQSKYVKPMFRIHLGLPDPSSPNAQRRFCPKCNYVILLCFFLVEICLCAMYACTCYNRQPALICLYIRVFRYGEMKQGCLA